VLQGLPKEFDKFFDESNMVTGGHIQEITLSKEELL
jgi:hypothetical protein